MVFVKFNVLLWLISQVFVLRDYTAAGVRSCANIGRLEWSSCRWVVPLQAPLWNLQMSERPPSTSTCLARVIQSAEGFATSGHFELVFAPLTDPHCGHFGKQRLPSTRCRDKLRHLSNCCCVAYKYEAQCFVLFLLVQSTVLSLIWNYLFGKREQQRDDAWEWFRFLDWCLVMPHFSWLSD